MAKTLDPIQIVIKAVDQFSKTMQMPIKSIGDFKTAVSGMRGPVVAAASAAAAAFAAAELKYAEMADQAYKASQKAGTTVETFTSLAYAASQSDVSTEELSKGLAKLSKTAYDAATGGKASQDAFKALGVNIYDVNGKLLPTDVMLKKIADSFEKHADGATKAALAQAVFGKSGADLIPFLNSGSKGINELQLEAAKLGLVLSDKTAKAAQELNDNLDALKNIATTGVMNAMNKELMPTLAKLSAIWKELAGDMMERFKPALEKVGEAIGIIFEYITQSAITIWSSLKLVGDAIGGLAAAATQIYRGEFKEALDIYKMTFEDAKTTIVTAQDAIKRSWEKSGDAAKKSGTSQQQQYANIVKAGEAARKAKDKQRQADEAREKLNASTKLKIQSDFLSALESLQNSKLKAMAAVAKAVGIADATISTYKAANAALDMKPWTPMNLVYAAMAVATGLSNVAKISGVALAEGGVVTSPMHPLVGEAGPEAVIPLDRTDLLNNRPIENHIYIDGNELIQFLQKAHRDGRYTLGYA